MKQKNLNFFVPHEDFQAEGTLNKKVLWCAMSVPSSPNILTQITVFSPYLNNRQRLYFLK